MKPEYLFLRAKTVSTTEHPSGGLPPSLEWILSLPRILISLPCIAIDELTVAGAHQVLPDPQILQREGAALVAIDILVDEMHAAVAHGDIGALRVHALDSALPTVAATPGAHHQIIE